jgi:hypothetical protein
MSDSSNGVCSCGACAGVEQSTPVAIENPPGLSAIKTRIGDYARFRASMIAGLSDVSRPALASLTTRAGDDFTIALLDAFAMVADVLTFYQERFAQENYLRTATELRSIQQLARLIGYEFNPGVAASVALAFTLDSTAGSPLSLDLPAGTRAQSTPGPNESARVFETSEDFTAFGSLNALRPRRSKPFTPGAHTKSVWLRGASLNLKAGDPLLFISAARLANPVAGTWVFRRILSVTSNPQTNVTQVVLQESIGVHLGAHPKVFVLRKQASLFGYNATPWQALPVAWRVGEVNPDPSATQKFLPGKYAGDENNWNDQTFDPSANTIALDTTYSQITAKSWILLAITGGGVTPPCELFRVDAAQDCNIAKYATTGRVTQLSIQGENIDEFSPLQAAVYGQSEELKLAPGPIGEPVNASSEQLDSLAPDLVKGRAVIVAGPRPRVTLAKGVKLTLHGAHGKTRALVAGEQLFVVDYSLPSSGGKRTYALETLDGFSGAVASDPSALLWTPALASDPVFAEAATIAACKANADASASEIAFAAPLTGRYDRGLAIIYGNVAPATAGQSVTEALGSGDGGKAFQSFQLRQPPLTFTAAALPGGGRSTLRISVNQTAWTQVDTLYGQGANARVFAIRNDENAQTRVLFGDGATFGARPPTGVNTIQATYRSGLGAAGNVDAGQVNILLSRPLGLKAVTNPLAASGGADPQPTDDARAQAPLSVSTLNRAVSLLDYQNFALCFAGVAKAEAGWDWQDGQRWLVLTLAGVDGATIDPASKLAGDLAAALSGFGDPTTPLRLRSFTPVSFRIGVEVLPSDPTALSDTLARVEAALRDAFSFANRALGQWVMLSEVVAAAQNVTGVLAVEITQLYRVDQPRGLNPILEASAAVSGGQGMGPAELLTLDPAPFDKLGAMG